MSYKDNSNIRKKHKYPQHMQWVNQQNTLLNKNHKLRVLVDNRFHHLNTYSNHNRNKTNIYVSISKTTWMVSTTFAISTTTTTCTNYNLNFHSQMIGHHPQQMYDLRARFVSFKSRRPSIKTSKGDTPLFQTPHTNGSLVKRQRKIYRFQGYSSMQQIIVRRWNKPKLSCQDLNCYMKGMKQRSWNWRPNL